MIAANRSRGEHVLHQELRACRKPSAVTTDAIRTPAACRSC